MKKQELNGVNEKFQGLRLLRDIQNKTVDTWTIG